MFKKMILENSISDFAILMAEYHGNVDARHTQEIISAAVESLVEITNQYSDYEIIHAYKQILQERFKSEFDIIGVNETNGYRGIIEYAKSMAKYIAKNKSNMGLCE